MLTEDGRKVGGNSDETKIGALGHYKHVVA